MQVDEILQPCPFCGGTEVTIESNSDIDSGIEDWIIQCDGCGAAFLASNDFLPCTRSELIDKWNKRGGVAYQHTPGVFYSPMAITQDGQKLFTYDSVLTMEKALNQFSIWEDHYGYRIKEAWIERTDGKQIKVDKRWVEVTENAGQ